MMDFRRTGLALAILAALAAVVGVGFAGLPAKARRQAPTIPTPVRLAAPSAPAVRLDPMRGPARDLIESPAGIQSVQRAEVIDNLRRIDVNTINMFVTNYGSFAWDLTSGDPGLIWPKGTNKTAVFAGGIWFGADVGGEIRTLVAEYSQEYGPGAMIGTTFDDPTKQDYRTWKVVRFTGDPAETSHVEREANEAAIEDPLVHHSWSEYMAGAAPYGAPWKLYRLPITATSDPSDSVDVPGPDVIGDMMMWSIYNDADPGRHTNDAGGSAPLGLEIQQTTFAFNRQGALGNIVFFKYKIKNKGGQQLDSCFVSIWSDPDLGGAADDLVGVDIGKSLGYCYNSTNNDQLYGSAPPAVGYDFFQGPRYIASDPSYPPLPVSSFNKYINGTDPASTSDTYNYMNGLLPDGSDVIDPTTGLPTKFFHPGDPTTGQGWLDSNPADRRLLLTSGPFYMSPGDSQEVVAAVIIGNGNDRLSSVTALKFYDEFAQLAFDEGFDLPSPPPQPKVDVATGHETVTLSWDAAALTNYNEPGYEFEGYNVYQGASIAGPWKRLATYDLVNGILTVRDTVFDFQTGQTIADYPVAFGTDAGLRFTYTTTQDQIRGGPLHDGMEYYYAVTAYAVSSTEKLAVVENAQTPVTAVPQRPPSGTDVSTAGTTDVIHLRKNENLPPSTTVIEPVVVQPESVKAGHIYKVTFEALPPESVYTRQVGADTATVRFTWTLTDSTTGQVLFSGQLNQTCDENYRVVDGLQVRVCGAMFPALQDIAYRNLVATHRRALEGVNFGLGYFNGGGDYAANFFGSTIDPSTPDSFTTVEVRFSHTTTQKAYRFVRMQTTTGGAPTSYPNRGYLFRGFVDVPFTVWDATNDIQLDVGFLEKEVTDNAGVRLGPPDQLASSDSTWGPTAGADGGREYLFIYRRPYDGTAKAELAVDASVLNGTVPVLYTVGPKLRAATDVIDDGDMLEFVFANPATTNDIYVFSTTPLVRGDAALAKSVLDRIRVVPNPYYNRSRYELNQFARKIRFINMPEQATVRIFNLAGDLVRTLHKTDPTTSILEWDVLTENQLPVGSGVYIYHVDAPGVGSAIGKMAVFMEKERLNNF